MSAKIICFGERNFLQQSDSLVHNLCLSNSNIYYQASGNHLFQIFSGSFFLLQINTDEDIILHSGQMYPYSWSSDLSKSIHFCLNATGDWKWSEPLDLDKDGIFPRKLEHKKLTSLVFVEVKKISGIQVQVDIFLMINCVF